MGQHFRGLKWCAPVVATSVRVSVQKSMTTGLAQYPLCNGARIGQVNFEIDARSLSEAQAWENGTRLKYVGNLSTDHLHCGIMWEGTAVCDLNSWHSLCRIHSELHFKPKGSLT